MQDGKEELARLRRAVRIAFCYMEVPSPDFHNEFPDAPQMTADSAPGVVREWVVEQLVMAYVDAERKS